MDFTDFVGPTRVEEDALSGGGLAGIDVRHDANIAVFFYGSCACHTVFSTTLKS